MITSSPVTTTVFNPALLSDDDLIRSFVARQSLLERILDDVRSVDQGSIPQHQLIIGQRGMGKTTLLRRIAIAVRQNAELAAHWIPLEFPEEQYNVKNLGDFWLNCADALSDALEQAGLLEQAAELDRLVTTLTKDADTRSAAAFTLLISAAERLGRGLLLLVDNIDIILDRLEKSEEWEFRRILSENPLLYVFGGSSRALEAFYTHGRAFFDFFNVHELRSFSDEDMFALLNQLAEQGHNEEVQKIIREQPARIRALRVLTGGNPRTLVLLYRVLSQGPDGDVRRDIEQLLDTYTPLYKARFEEMSPQAQQIVDCMAIHWDPISAAEIAVQLETLPVNQVSAQLKRLEDFGIVEKVARYGDKKTAFQVAERFFNIWYLMRASRRERRKLVWLVRFLEAWFEPNELERYAEALLGRDISSAEEAEIRLLMSQIINDKPLSRSLTSSGLKTALKASVRSQFDFKGLPVEVLAQKERMELLRNLELNVCQLYSDKHEAEDFWSLAGGSPFLTLQEKRELVLDRLPSLDPSARRSLLDKLRRERRRLTQSVPDHAGDVERLYRAINGGEMAEACDIDGALSLERPSYRGWLPVVALISQISQYCSPGKMDDDRIMHANAGVARLEGMTEYAAPAALLRASFLRIRLLKVLEAEASYRKAIDLDSDLWQPWQGLGTLLCELGGRDEEALQALEKARMLNPTAASVLNNIGRVLTNLGRYTAAEDAFRGALELDPEAAYAKGWLGNLLETHLGKYPEAEACYRDALLIEPENDWTWNALGNLLTSFGQDRAIEAEDAYRRAINIDPLNPDHWSSFGTLLLEIPDRGTEAENALRKALELDRASYRAWFGLARLALTDHNRLAEFIHAIYKVYEYAPKDALKIQSPVELIRRFTSLDRDPAVAVKAISEQHDLQSEDWELTFLLVQALVLQGEWSRASTLLRRLIENSGEDNQPDIQSFLVIAQRGYAEEAAALLEQTGAHERWRPLYEALRAYSEGTADYLLSVAPEIRVVSQAILDKIAPTGLSQAKVSEKTVKRAG